MQTTFNLATSVKGLIKLTNERDEPVEAEISVVESGFDPVESVHLVVRPAAISPFTCHVLFPEISCDRLPSRIHLGIKIHSDQTHVVLDGADRNGPCVALPVYRSGSWVQGSNVLDMSREYMVWKEGRARKLEPPLRIKYLLLMSHAGGPIDVELQGLTLEE